MPSLPEPKLLEREAILLAVTRAASAAASGRDDAEAQRVLDGALFTFPIRFGCGPAGIQPQGDAAAIPAAKTAPAAADRGAANTPPEPLPVEPMSWRYDPARDRLEVTATPDVDLTDAAVATIAGTAYEAVEGFWIQRPWLLEAACPAAAPAAAVAQRASPSLAIAQFHAAEDSRTGRRDDRSYQSVATLPPEQARDLARGFDLVLSGRLRRLKDGKVINCIAAGADARPICIVSAEIQKVELKRGDSGALLAEWSQG
ncbi:hypothetical protein E2493_13505 [Sphingomonas parva]|uniref:Uncharacterized protein n=1 Tax=Sphingomonas parva TaxID=2555898 RepID=A0A4Y8ZR35_9SPHN|nr:hypothetical protein [Sphingomonas parva]TFI57742.1 hypothetical protein E2493_13505 [Sphingomonas parva]